MQQPKLKTFVANNHVELEKMFNEWFGGEETLMEVVNTSFSYSSALQKYVLAVVYQELAVKGVPAVGESDDV